MKKQGVCILIFGILLLAGMRIFSVVNTYCQSNDSLVLSDELLQQDDKPASACKATISSATVQLFETSIERVSFARVSVSKTFARFFLRNVDKPFFVQYKVNEISRSLFCSNLLSGGYYIYHLRKIII